MNASLYEQELAQTHGIAIRHWHDAEELEVSWRCCGDHAGKARSMHQASFDRHRRDRHRQADQVFKAIGQTPDAGPLAGVSITLEKGRIKRRRTNRRDIAWPRSGPAATASPPAKISPWSPSKTARSPLKAFTKP
jgi:dihydropyrimidine dehydrogenase (NAD+) subunit PreT